MARSIGHTSFGITLRHYVDPAVKATLDARRVDAVLAKLGDSSLGGSLARTSASPSRVHSLSDEEEALLLQALSADRRVQ